MPISTSTSGTETPVVSPNGNGTIKAGEPSLSEAIEQLKSASADVCEAMGTLGSASAHTAKSQFEQSKHKALEATDRAEAAMQQKPLMAAGIAFAAGWVLSRMLQSSRK